MQKFVIETYRSDVMTYSYLTLEYESKEKLEYKLLELEEVQRKLAADSGVWDFEFMNHSIPVNYYPKNSVNDSTYYKVFTLEEWFEEMRIDE